MTIETTIQQTPTASEAARPRKILFLIDRLMGMGGAEGALAKMVRHLPRYGFDCSIGAFGLTDNKEFLANFPCPVYNLSLTCVYNLQALRVARELRQIVTREQFDIIHTMFPSSDLWGGPLARLGSKALLVSGRRDLGIVREAKHNLAYRLLRNQYDQVQAVSEAARQACIKQDGLSPERVFTVHNGIEIGKIQQTSAFSNLAQTFGVNPLGRTVISSAGQLWPVKGADVLIRAAALVCKQVPETNFLITGFSANQYGRELQELARSLGLEKNVRLPGRLTGILSVLKACDVFALTSRSEGLSNGLLEAMACGLPCVATNVGGNPEVIEDGKSGLLVPSEDHEAIAARILELLRNPAKARALGASGNERVATHFSVDAMASRMANLYQNMLNQRCPVA